jgi:hypothetical protein
MIPTMLRFLILTTFGGDLIYQPAVEPGLSTGSMCPCIFHSRRSHVKEHHNRMRRFKHILVGSIVYSTPACRETTSSRSPCIDVIIDRPTIHDHDHGRVRLMNVNHPESLAVITRRMSCPSKNSMATDAPPNATRRRSPL